MDTIDDMIEQQQQQQSLLEPLNDAVESPVSSTQHSNSHSRGDISNASQHVGLLTRVADSGERAPEETLTVIVQLQDDSRDSQLLSPEKLTPNDETTIMDDTADFRSLHEPTYQTLTSVNGRMSPPGFSPGSSYATLTPLQPLPPISTMSDKFAYGHATGVLQNNGMGIGLALGSSSPYAYDKLPSMGMSPPHDYSPPANTLGAMVMSQQHSPLSPHSAYSQNGLQSPQKSLSPSGYDSPYGQRPMQQSPVLSPPSSGSVRSPDGGMGGGFGSGLSSLNGLNQHTNAPPGLVQISHVIREQSSPSPPLLTLQTQGKNINNATLLQTTSVSAPSDGEEINTKELAQRISAELKRYSIPQAIFAQRVLCRSQGTLSDLLRNPKPWSKLKSGRETFRRMYKWLQEPEFQRMSALRLAGKLCNFMI
ncbi:one cut domain family member 2-like [Ctenocephalides felis]|uniref:one cut domain family member 2-like n=1 Tax=Ctenocephalides felis TaxID=7515 RepID=UPI000E6E286D|nr:one cut domain family member 2-like [Ctenocephalides felis]